MASNNGGPSIQLTSTQLYWLYGFLTLGDVVLAYVAKILPQSYGVSGLAAIAIAFFGTVAHDFTTAHTPNGVPTWVTYVIITIASALAGAIGFFTSDTTLTVSAFVAWFIIVLSAIANDVTEDAGANLPTYAETVIVTVIGLTITVLTWFASNPTATVAALVATVIAVLSSYFHVSMTAAVKSAPTGTVPA
jgi:hypothetical protein